MSLEHPLVQRAHALAATAHAGQRRKGGDVAYLTHLEGVAELLATHGHAEPETLAAALLHDLIEDQPAYAEQLAEEMPPAVVQLVRALSETKRDGAGNPLPKAVRFEGYLQRLGDGTEVARRALPISCADKVHNTRSLLTGEAFADGLLLGLSTRPGQHGPQLRRLRALYAPVVSPALLSVFDEVVSAFLSKLEAWLPGRAVMIAAEAHLGQWDKGGQPYIMHPLRLMMAADEPESAMTAVLHDVVEDSSWTLEQLRAEGFPSRVLRALDALTRRDDESYDAFIDRVGANGLATRVKLLDLRDNMNLDRIPNPTDEDHRRLERYARAERTLAPRLKLRSLQVRLDAESRRVVRDEARLPILRGEHVTLVYREDPCTLDAAWLPEGRAVGDSLELRAVREVIDTRVQAWEVELAGSSRRPRDGGTLHVTVSRAEGARSYESNELLRSAPGTVLDVYLRGRIEWVPS